MNNELNQREAALEIRNLVRYYGDFLAVDGLTLKVRKGEVFGFLGPNGAGKTTSIRMMCGLLKPTSGEVLINGVKVTHAGIRSRNMKVGICPQDIILWMHKAYEGDIIKLSQEEWKSWKKLEQNPS